MLFIKRFSDWSDQRALVALTIGFILSRIVFHFLGLIFYSEFIKRLWQSIDLELLKTDLIQSLYYSHAQPPLFNLLIGIVVKLFPGQFGNVFHVLFLGITWISGVLLFLTLRKLNIQLLLSLFIAFYFMICPSVVLYENLLSYTMPVIFLITLSMYCFVAFIEENKEFYWFMFWVVLSALALTRSSYHLLWLVAIFVLLMFVLPKRKFFSFRYLGSALIPFSLVFLWYLKNFILFGIFTSSSWLGMNMARIMPPNTSLGRVGSFRPVQEYKVISDSSYHDVKLLHQPLKTNTGFVNYYHLDYIQISNEFKAEVVSEIKQHPIKYLNRVGKAFLIYLSPTTHGPFIDKNLKHISFYASLMNLNFSAYKKFVKDDFSFSDAVPVLLVYLLILIGLFYSYKTGLLNDHFKPVLILILFLLFYNLVTSNLIEYGENNRFRFETITFILILIAKISSGLLLRAGKSS